MLQATFDVIVVGGGHAGCEAAAAAARMGARTALVTHSFATIGEMSCNPAIGGLGKGHLVREIDALDGLMGRVADAAGIQFRLLNRSKGPAVQGPRAQADRKLYRAAMQAAIRATPNLEVIEGAVEDLVVENGAVAGIVTADGRGNPRRRGGAHDRHLPARPDPSAARRRPPPAATASRRPTASRSACWRSSLRLGRLKTGTPARLDGRTIDWASLEMQAGDDPPIPFSFLTERIENAQINCGVTTTTEATHAIIRANLARSPMYSGQIGSVGPRYCPSIEDKVVRFAGRTGPPDLPGARGPRRRHGLSQRRLDLAAGRRAGGLPAHHSGAGEGGHPALRLRHRVRLRGPPRARPDAGGQASAAAVPGRPDQRHHRLRGSRRPGHRRRHQRRAEGVRQASAISSSRAPTATWA